jgi:hypothetical protein
MPKQYTYSDELYSDLHKDAYGHRPGEFGILAWGNSSPDEKQIEWDQLCAILDRNEKERFRDESANLDLLNKEIYKLIGVGVEHNNAVKYLLEQWFEDNNITQPNDNDLGAYEYDNGLAYGTMNKLLGKGL